MGRDHDAHANRSVYREKQPQSLPRKALKARVPRTRSHIGPSLMLLEALPARRRSPLGTGGGVKLEPTSITYHFAHFVALQSPRIQL